MGRRVVPLLAVTALLLAAVWVPAALGDGGVTTGEHLVGNGHGQAAVEPAFNSETGDPLYILTPVKAPLPAKANPVHATAPLYIVAYPSGTTLTSFNCEGIPGNCPDHDLLIAQAAHTLQSDVYPDPTNDPSAVPGHDHLLAPPASGGDFNIAWEVWVVAFTPQGVSDKAIDTRLTTEDAINAAVEKGDAVKWDLGFAFTCAVVPSVTYEKGAAIGG